MCRACRYTRCLEVGMNPAGVQQRRDTIGKRDIKNEMPDATVDLLDPQQFTSSVPTTSSPCPPVSELPYACASQMPILLKMRSNYGKMDSARLVIHRKDGENIFEETISKSVNYKEAAEQGIREVPLVADWISGCFDGLASLPIEQKVNKSRPGQRDVAEKKLVMVQQYWQRNWCANTAAQQCRLRVITNSFWF
uniref:Nuclear receptor domain-containing protein n=1 Tax=Caenorhabditis japonica TaxID=281687 RepID=A0A8R1I546_CAEJA